MKNWAGNVTFGAQRTHQPVDIAELQGIVARADQVKAIGTGHSFNRIADTVGDLISTDALPRTIDIDVVSQTARIGGGVCFTELAPELERQGFALPSMASFPQLTVTGAAATGTHGSGETNGVLARYVRSLRVVEHSGELRTISGDELLGAAVGLGAAGIIAEITLDLVPTFTLRQYVYTGLSQADLVTNLNEIVGAAYSVSVFTTWTDSSLIVLKLLAGEPPARWLGASLADRPIPVIEGGDIAAGTQQLGVPGPWYERLPHFRAGFTPSVGAELQSEYFVPRSAGRSAVEAVFALRDQLAGLVLVSELRTVAADDLWLSPAYGQDMLALHFTWRPDEPRVRAAVAEIERRLAEFGARPHWGKVFCMAPERIAELYPRLDDFSNYLRSRDPAGVFGNQYLDRYIHGSPTP